MVDPESSATITLFELFQKIETKAKIPVEALKQPNVALRDYSQRCLCESGAGMAGEVSDHYGIPSF